MRISGITFDRFWEVLKSTWHVALLVLWLIWTIGVYKASLDAHLQNIDQHLKVEDLRLNWLVNHSAKDPNGDYTVPPDFDQQSVKPKPQSWFREPRIAEGAPSLDAGIPIHP